MTAPVNNITYIHTHTNIYIYIHTHIHTHTRTHIYIKNKHIYTHPYIQKYSYIHIFGKNLIKQNTPKFNDFIMKVNIKHFGRNNLQNFKFMKNVAKKQ